MMDFAIYKYFYQYNHSFTMSKTIRSFELTQPCQRRNGWLSAFLLATIIGGQSLPGQAQTVSYSAPIVITQGGTYTGNYQSLSSGTPCVRVTTNDPVILTGCTFSGAGNLVEATEGVNLTIRNCTGQGLTPSVNNQAPGHFLAVYKAKNLVIEHNAFTQTSGIVVDRWSSASQAGQSLTVRYNGCATSMGVGATAATRSAAFCSSIR